MEAFSDGVFAFAATLLVIDLAIHPPGSPLDQVFHAWPSYVAYLISFLTIGAAWLAHTAMTDRLERTDSIFLRLNLLLLLVVTFLPFPTGLVGDALREPGSERVFVTMYGVTLLAIRLTGFALAEYADRERLYATAGDDEEQRERKQLWPVVAAYAAALAIGLAFPVPAVWVYLGIAVYLVVPFRDGRRLVSERA
jgi:TMEM175 potassium channel family protein